MIDSIYTESPPVRGAWIETMNSLRSRMFAHSSPPVRGAWIETDISKLITPTIIVASREGGVD